MFFCKDTATAEIYTVSLHVALPIWVPRLQFPVGAREPVVQFVGEVVAQSRHPCGPPRVRRAPIDDLVAARSGDRKSTRLNSSHANISYAVFCLKKKKLP